MLVRKIRFFIPIVFSLFFLSVTSILQSSTAYAAWTQNIIDTSVDASSMSLDVDSNGFMHITYVGESIVGYEPTEPFDPILGTVIRYASFNGSGWNIQTLDTGGSFRGGRPSIELNSQGYAQISYGIEGNLRYASFNGAGWNIQTIASGSSSSLALNSQGYAQISYTNTLVINGFGYASFNGSGWNIQSVATNEAEASSELSIALDSQGYACISYYQLDIGLKYAAFNGSGWNTQIIEGPFEHGRYTSLGLDSSGYAHISYFDGVSYGDTKYASFNGTGWVINIIDSATAGQTSLAFDSNGYAYISYIGSPIVDYDYSDPENPEPIYRYDLNLAHFNGTGWEIQTLYSDINYYGGYPSDTALGLFNNYVYITYAQQGGDLASTTDAPQGFVPEPATDILGKILLFGLPVCFWRGRIRG